ncbi:hypothetical protein ABZP36_017264 [Zizania latifolia]
MEQQKMLLGAAAAASPLAEALLPGKEGDCADDVEAQLPSYHTGASFSRTCLNLANAVSGTSSSSVSTKHAYG